MTRVCATYGNGKVVVHMEGNAREAVCVICAATFNQTLHRSVLFSRAAGSESALLVLGNWTAGRHLARALEPANLEKQTIWIPS